MHHLPELDQGPERRARRDERGLLVGAGLEAVDDADAAAFEGVDRALEVRRFEREMVQPLAALRDEPLDEAPLRGTCDELELEVADEEVAPRVVAGVTEKTFVHGDDREVAAEERERGVDVAHRDRQVVDAHRRTIDHACA